MSLSNLELEFSYDSDGKISFHLEVTDTDDITDEHEDSIEVSKKKKTIWHTLANLWSLRHSSTLPIVSSTLFDTSYCLHQG